METHTTLAGQTITIRTRKDGRMTRPTVAAILADFDARLVAIRATLAEYDAAYPDWSETICPDEVAERWNDLHDYERELESLRREVELNRAPVAWGSTAWLASQNID